MKFALITALALLMAVPAHAQPALPPPLEETGIGARAFRAMSEAGQRTMAEALEPLREADRADRARVRAARDRILGILDAPRLDAAALRSAMLDERSAATAMKARQQEALARAFERVSPEDRRAFSADARAVRNRIEGRLRDGPVRQRLRERMRDRLSAVPPGDVPTP